MGQGRGSGVTTQTPSVWSQSQHVTTFRELLADPIPSPWVFLSIARQRSPLLLLEKFLKMLRYRFRHRLLILAPATLFVD
jgi:hypothetical protein